MFVSVYREIFKKNQEICPTSLDQYRTSIHLYKCIIDKIKSMTKISFNLMQFSCFIYVCATKKQEMFLKSFLNFDFSIPFLCVSVNCFACHSYCLICYFVTIFTIMESVCNYNFIVFASRLRQALSRKNIFNA